MKSFLTGLATGVAIGYLTAPRTGKETRQKLSDSASEQTGKLKDQWPKLKDQVSQLLDSALSNLGLDLSESDQNGTAAQKQAKTAYNQEVDETADATKSAVNQARESLKV